LRNGRPGETYNIGGNSEKANIDVVTAICNLVDEMRPRLASGAPRTSLITYVTDRPGHDRRYAIDATKISRELGWKPEQEFVGGLRRTVEWYLNNSAWIENVRTLAYRGWIEKNYAERVVL
jgi:dTDP-glucose 4,6-dehydratase